MHIYVHSNNTNIIFIHIIVNHKSLKINLKPKELVTLGI